MADKHPYISGTGGVVQLLDQLKKSFPAVLNADVLKKLSIAPSNESYVINIVRFLGLIDEAGNRQPDALKIFTLHDDASFQKGFSGIIETAYKDLFALHAKDAWTLSVDQLIPFFRQADQSSMIVGGRQASTFRALATYAGHTDPHANIVSRPVRTPSKRTSKVNKKDDTPKNLRADVKAPLQSTGKEGNVGLTVRIEVNLPAAGDQETYDRIFRSIKENLLNG